MSWTDIWSYNQQDYRSWPSKVWQDHQEIQILMNHHADEIRIRFSNRYGIEPISFESVSICTKELSESVPITVSGQKLITIFPDNELVSDPIKCHIEPGTVVQLDTHLLNPVALTGGIVTYSRSITVVKNFDRDYLNPQDKQFRMVNENPKMQYIYGISGIDIPQNEKKHKSVVFGDSLVQQGFIVDQLKLRLLKEKLADVAIINRGIGGSRILSGTDRNFDYYNRHGLPGTLRFEPDIFAKGPVDSIIIIHGINDIITAFSDSAKNMFSIEELIKGWKQYAEFAKIHDTPCFICTLMPFGESIFFRSEYEAYRQEVNSWIKNNQSFDGYFDLDKAVSDEKEPFKLKNDYDSGDGLHLSENGGKRVAMAIDVDIFNQKN